MVAFLLMVVLAQNTGLWPTLADDVPASEKAALRQNWRLEKQMWVMEKAQWALEQTKHQEETAMWERERQERQEEREAFEREKEELERQRQEEREEWARQCQEERDAFEREKEEWARQRVEENRHRKEIEWRRRGAHWSEPWPASSQCHGFGTRAYSANLLNLPGDVNYLEACKGMPIKINDQWMDGPDNCEQDVSTLTTSGLWTTTNRVASAETQHLGNVVREHRRVPMRHLLGCFP